MSPTDASRGYPRDSTDETLELITQRERLRILEAAVETMSLGVTISDASGKVLYVNAADARLHGYERDELVGESAALYEAPRTPRLEPPATNAATPWLRDTWNRTKSGELIPVRLVSDQIRNERGERVALVTVCEDLRRETQLRQALLRRDRILEACGVVAERLLGDARPREGLAAALAALGEATGSDAVRFELLEVIHQSPTLALEWLRSGGPPEPDAPSRSVLLRELAPEFQLGAPLAGDLSRLPPALAADLQRRGMHAAVLLWVEVDSSAWGVLSLESARSDRTWEPIELEAVTIAARSLSAVLRRERSLAELEATERKYQRLVDEASDLIQSVDADGRVRYANRAWLRAMGYDEQALMTLTLESILAPEKLASCRKVLSEMFATGDARRLETVFVGANGRRIEVEGAVSLQLEGSQPVATLGIFRDVGERKRLERMQQEFLGTVSHELRTPLTSMLGSISLLEHPQLAGQEEKRRELLGIAIRNGDRLLRLISDLLDLQKLEANEFRARIASTTVGEILAAAVEGIDGMAQTCGVHVEAIDETGDADLRTDRERVEQVLFNLLSNAIKFSPSGGDVRIEARIVPQGGDRVELSVSDRGPGVPVELRERVFERFAQADSSSSRRVGGTGLGLAIARGIVVALGGEIALEEAPLGGTRAVVRLPRNRLARRGDGPADRPPHS